MPIRWFSKYLMCPCCQKLSRNSTVWPSCLYLFCEYNNILPRIDFLPWFPLFCTIDNLLPSCKDEINDKYNKHNILDALISPWKTLFSVLPTAVSKVADSVDEIADSCRQYPEGNFYLSRKKFLEKYRHNVTCRYK